MRIIAIKKAGYCNSEKGIMVTGRPSDHEICRTLKAR